MFNHKQERNLSPERLEYLKSRKRRKVSVLVTQIVILVVFLAQWEILARLNIVDSFITSQPSRIVNTIINLYKEGQLLHHIGITCLETVVALQPVQCLVR